VKDRDKERHLGGGPPWVRRSVLASGAMAGKGADFIRRHSLSKYFATSYSVEGSTSLIATSMPR
jgi:hypothetical protein